MKIEEIHEKRELSWCAGFIEGEGTIYINKLKSSYNLVLEVHNTEKGLIERMQKTLGGTIRSCREKSEELQVVYIWSTTGMKAIEAIKRLSAHFWMSSRKRKLANIAVAFMEYKKRHVVAGSKSSMKARMDQNNFYQAMKILNARGKRAIKLKESGKLKVYEKQINAFIRSLKLSERRQLELY